MTDQITEANQDTQHHRSIRSYVLRQSHMTAAQQRAIDTLWPQFGLDYQETPADLNQAFGRSNRKILEIGFGMGSATAEIASNNPDKNYIGIEVHKPGIGKLLGEIRSRNLENLRIIEGDASAVLSNMIADAWRNTGYK